MRTAASVLVLLASVAAATLAAPRVAGAAPGPIAEVAGFGSNPGALKMFEYAPAGLAANKPVVVVLHGCTETAQSAAATGWNELADQLDFLVVYPQQETGNNPIRCFNWGGEYGNPENLQRGKGENLSIKQMVDKAIADHQSDPKRVFVVGFSAGGGTAAIMAATHPDVFAGAATISGIPFDCTTTYSEVSSCMKPGKDLSAQAWGDKVRAAHQGYAGPWPKMSIWQGSADTIVGTLNRTELVEQWTNVHGVSQTPTATDKVDGHARSVFEDSKGNVVVETYVIDGMAHAVPISGTGCGTPSAYAIDKGICAAKHIASFFGLAGGGGGGTSSSGGGSSSSSSSSASSASGGVATDGGAGASSGGDGASSSGGAAADDLEEPSYESTCSLGAAPHERSSAGAGLWGVVIAIATITFIRSNRKGGSR